MQKDLNHQENMEELRLRAETQLHRNPDNRLEPPAEAVTQRLFHELQVHQIELEMQNEELRSTRDAMELLVNKYTELYDFAPIGFFSIDANSRILEVNLTGSTLLEMNRSQLVNQPFSGFMLPESRTGFQTFLEQLTTWPRELSHEVTLQKADGTLFCAVLYGTAVISQGNYRLAVTDITDFKQAEKIRSDLENMVHANAALRKENIHQLTVEKNLRDSERQKSHLLEQSRHMQDQLRFLSRRLVSAQEEERKRISRELHDEISQTLIGINVHLEILAQEGKLSPKDFKRKIERTRTLVEKTVEIAHGFAEDLRPPVLDDLGLIPALHAFLNKFMKESNVRTSLKVFAGVENLNSNQRTALFRITQEALSNVSRHANATRVQITIKKVPNAIHMKIKDNGQAFDVDDVLKAKTSLPLGLIGMRERIEMVGGLFSIDSKPGKGTTICALIPLKDEKKETPDP